MALSLSNVKCFFPQGCLPTNKQKPKGNCLTLQLPEAIGKGWDNRLNKSLKGKHVNDVNPQHILGNPEEPCAFGEDCAHACSGRPKKL